ncbi:LuxR C-terminal-related transcriptional regulator [Aureisphaera galaxeae]|uniref:LuxR C-terminal-related transcriptional regulator n=1 Tax=Aureisphaera galaxeae TaxID=1538023 RepID=UPI002350F478|nr:LuxR C-terminal-related transcriptional regulator [Aureisphaera galaxeae]MDC8003601.1 LuxR C-terminal-related transcriptional regulator [Aureisphaera galaxeae]
MKNETNLPYRSLLSFGAFLILFQLAIGQSQGEHTPGIRGKLQLDSIWDPVVYLSHIPTLNDMYHMSTGMIISEASLDSLGNFSFATDYLSEDDQLYRIHISKKGAPMGSLIIGGDEENHMFVVGNKYSSIVLENIPGNPPFTPVEIQGYRPAQELREVDRIYTYVDSTHFKGSSVKGEFVTKAIYEKLRFVADTSSHSLVSLYALHRSKFETNYPINKSFYEGYLKKWKGEKSNYFKTFRSQLPQESSKDYTAYILIGLAFFILGFVLNHFLKRKKKKGPNPIQKLSVQERKILEEIKQGRSNKEISETFNIGLSTVKSHVSSIYTKLNIKSRKEAMDF